MIFDHAKLLNQKSFHRIVCQECLETDAKKMTGIRKFLAAENANFIAALIVSREPRIFESVYLASMQSRRRDLQTNRKRLE